MTTSEAMDEFCLNHLEWHRIHEGIETGVSARGFAFQARVHPANSENPYQRWCWQISMQRMESSTVSGFLPTLDMAALRAGSLIRENLQYLDESFNPK